MKRDLPGGISALELDASPHIGCRVGDQLSAIDGRNLGRIPDGDFVLPAWVS